MTGSEETRPEPGPESDVEQIQSDIEQTRQELGQTVGALSAKLDVKERAKHRAAETRDSLAARSRQTKNQLMANKPAVTVTAIALLGAIAIGLVIWRRRH